MARTTITAQVPKGPYPTIPVVADSLDLTMTAADVANSNQAVLLGNRLLLVAHNSGASPYTVTITSVAKQGRTGDVSAYSMAAGDIMAFLLDQADGWMQTDGNVYFAASNVAVRFAVLKV